MPAHSVDPRIDKQRKYKAVEGAAHDHAGEECEDELEPAHRVTRIVDGADVTGGGKPGVGVDRTSAPSCPEA